MSNTKKIDDLINKLATDKYSLFQFLVSLRIMGVIKIHEDSNPDICLGETENKLISDHFIGDSIFIEVQPTKICLKSN